MPPVFNPNAAELIVKYTSMGRLHRASFHFSENLTGGEVANFMASFAAVHINVMRIGDAIQSVEQKQKGANFTVPYPFTPVNGTQSNNTVWQDDADSAVVSMIGRSQSSGQRARTFFYMGYRIADWPDDNRYRSGETPAVTDLINFWIEWLNGNIEESPHPPVSCADGTDAQWYPYLNFSKNGYWQRRQRG